MRFLRFHPNHFPFWTFNFLNLFYWRFAFSSRTFRLCPFTVTFTGTPSASVHKTMISGVSHSPYGSSLHTSFSFIPVTAAAKLLAWSPPYPASSLRTPNSPLPYHPPQMTSCISIPFLAHSNFPIFATFSLYPFHFDIVSKCSFCVRVTKLPLTSCLPTPLLHPKELFTVLFGRSALQPDLVFHHAFQNFLSFSQ